MRRSGQQGFTLIELIMVIVILGILAATALPKFADLGSDARKASLKGLQGGIKSAVAITKSAWLVDGSKPSTINGGITVSNTTGIPTADAAGIGAALSSYDGFGLSGATFTATDGGNATCNLVYSADGTTAIADGGC